MSWSKSKIDKLGERLRSAEEPTAEDLDLLDEVRALYMEPMRLVANGLIELGYSPTTRPEKTWQSTVEKLKRETIRLSQIRDLAGARVVVDGGMSAQDETVRRIGERFPDHKPIDRRENPMHGYRAFHLEVKVDGSFVEIQIRTPLQDLWAQVNEKVADLFGRGIRYGKPPDDPDLQIAEGVTSMSIIRNVLWTSEIIAGLEDVELRSEKVRGIEIVHLSESTTGLIPGIGPDEITAAEEQEFLEERIPKIRATLMQHLDRTRTMLEIVEQRLL